MGDRSAKERHHLISDMTVYGAAMAFDGVINGFEDAADSIVQILGVEQLRKPCVAGDVRIHDRNLAALPHWQRWCIGLSWL